MTSIICCSKSDMAIAKEIETRLVQAGVPLQTRPNSKLASSTICTDEQGELLDLTTVTTLLPLLSPRSVRSTRFLDNMSAARELRIRILPILIEDCEKPLQIHRVQHIDFRMNRDRAFAALIGELIHKSNGPTVSVASSGDTPQESDIGGANTSSLDLNRELVWPGVFEDSQTKKRKYARILKYLFWGALSVIFGISCWSFASEIQTTPGSVVPKTIIRIVGAVFIFGPVSIAVQIYQAFSRRDTGASGK